MLHILLRESKEPKTASRLYQSPGDDQAGICRRCPFALSAGHVGIQLSTSLLIAYTISYLGPECLGTPLQYAAFMIGDQKILADLFLNHDLS